MRWTSRVSAAPWVAAACFAAAACGAGAGAGDTVFVAEVAYEMPVLEEVTRIRKLVRVEETGEFWIFNSGEPHFIKADSAGRVLAAFGERGEGPGEIGYPAAIVGAGADWVEVVDSPREAWRRFDLTGKEIASTPLPGTRRFRVVVDLDMTSYGDQYQSYFDADRFIFPNFPRGLENTQYFWRTRLDRVDRRSRPRGRRRGGREACSDAGPAHDAWRSILGDISSGPGMKTGDPS